MEYEAKHDKKDKKVEFRKSAPLMGTAEYYKARIKHLEGEVARLTENLAEAEQSVAIMTQLYENSAESLQRAEARSDEIIAAKNDEIQMAKEAIYLAAMREVSMR